VARAGLERWRPHLHKIVVVSPTQSEPLFEVRAAPPTTTTDDDKKKKKEEVSLER
jgi:hypothetical protein